MSGKDKPVDLNACYVLIIKPPKRLLKEWEDGPKPTPENASYTFRDIDGTEHFCCGDTSITVSEHFRPAGKQPEELIEDVIWYAARTNRNS